MINGIKRYATAGVLAIGLLVMPMGSVSPAPQANAQTTAQLQAQIQALLAQVQQLQALLAQQGGSVPGLYCNFVFARDLTIGSTGEDVRNLQRFLNSVPGIQVAASGAGAPGFESSYYGPLTAAAVRAFQSRYAANVLAPLGLTAPTGYFGASSRAQAQRLCQEPPITSPDDEDDDDDVEDELRGGEADIRRFQILNDPRNEIIRVGDEEERVLGFEFQVDNSDISIRRVDVAFEANSTTSDEPWDYFEEVHLMHGDDVVASVRADRERDWDDRNSSRFSPADTDTYQIRFSGLDVRVDDGDRDQFYIAVTARDVIDSRDLDQDWNVWLPSNGVRMIDAVGINHYEPSGQSSAVSFTVSQAEAGDLNITEARDNPERAVLAVHSDANSDKYTVLVAEFEAGRVDVLVEDITVTATSTGADLDEMIRNVTLVIDGQEYRSDREDDGGTSGTYTFEDIDVVFEEDEEVEVAVVVEFLRTSGNFDGNGETIQFAIYGDDIDAEAADSGETSDVEGEAIGNIHTLMLFGLQVDNGSTSANAINTTTLTLGEYTLEFDVTALGEDIYIYNSVGTTSEDGVQINILKGNSDVTASEVGTFVGVLTSDDAQERNNSWRIRAGRTATFTVSITWDPATQGSYAMELDEILFLDSDSSDPTDYVAVQVPDLSAFQTRLITIAGN